ncbi:MAG: endolytic transglycosylase MltG [Calditrichia bacterium]
MKRISIYAAQVAFGIYLIWKNMTFRIKKHKIIAVVLPLIIIVAAMILLFPPYSEPDLSAAETETILIPRGSSLREVANILDSANVLQWKNVFILEARLSGYHSQIKAGLFKVPADMHPWHLLKYLTQPSFADIKVTLPEGILARDMAAEFSEKLACDSARFMALVNDSVYADSLGVRAGSLEGYLLPETYFSTYGVSEKAVINRLVGNTLAIFEPDSVQLQLGELNMSRHQVVTLASIIEGEVMVDSERVIVSSVYHNRLDRGWLLQADPTIQYILPEGPRRLLLKDLEIDSPYNTYRYAGLPPGPINNPGRGSILAALYPARTSYMYFVASGDGGHRFSRTAQEHARHKAQFNRIRREVARQKANGD